MRNDRDCIVTNFQQRFAASREDLQRDTGSYCRRKFVAGTDVDSPTLPLPVQRASYAGDNYRRRWLRCLLGERVSRRPGEIPTAVLGHDADDTLHTRTHTHITRPGKTARPAGRLGVREDRQQLLMDASGEEATGWMRKINMAVRRRADCAAPVAAASAADASEMHVRHGIDARQNFSPTGRNYFRQATIINPKPVISLVSLVQSPIGSHNGSFPAGRGLCPSSSVSFA